MYQTRPNKKARKRLNLTSLNFYDFILSMKIN